MEINSTSPEDTANLAHNLIDWTRQNQVNLILLKGDLGAGKTYLVRSVVGVLGGDPSDVSSPTFTLHNIYDCGDQTVHHYDLYRLESPGIMLDELEEAAGELNTICFVEWPHADVSDVDSSGNVAVVSIDRLESGEQHRLISVKLLGD